MWAVHKDLQGVQYGKGCNFRVKKADRHVLSTETMSASTVISHVVNMYSWYDVMKIALYFSDVIRIQNPSSIIGKTSDKSHLGAILQNLSPVLLKVVKVIKNRGSLWPRHSQDESKETWGVKRILKQKKEVKWKLRKSKKVWI